MPKVARYGLSNLLMLALLAALLTGGLWAWAVYGLTAALATVADEHAGDDLAPLGAGGRWFYEANLYASLPLVVLVTVALLLVAGSGPALGLVSSLASLGIDIEAARAATGAWSLAGGIVAVGLFYGVAAVNVAHELMHRTGNRSAWLTARWLLAFTWDTSFCIEHVHGHHRHVCTEKDPATARRGEYAMAFVWRSTIGQFRSAFAIETARLQRKGLATWSRHNLVLRGQLMSLAVTFAAFALAGWPGVAVFLLVALQGKIYLELVNYVEHYGLVRLPGSRVEPRHAWNCYHIVSSALLYNLPRHSHHHMFAAKPFWALEADPDAPTLPYGYKTMIVIALIPPLWHRVVDPMLGDWDARFATEPERAWLADRNLLISRPPIPALMQA